MSFRYQAIPVAGLLGTMAVAVYMVVQLSARERVVTGDLSAAAIAEVHDARGQVLLRGELAPASEAGSTAVARTARLVPPDSDGDAVGDVELTVASPEVQDLELSVRHLEPGLRITLVIDGQEVATTATDRRGRADLRVSVRPPSDDTLTD